MPQRQWQRPQWRTFSASIRLPEKKYTQDHEWIELSADGKTATLGISAYAAEQLGEVIFVELPQTDMEVGHGDAIGTVESVKSASDIMTPVSGKVVDTNKKLEEQPKLMNQSPEDDAWIAKVEIADQAEMEGLMGPEEYKKFTDEVAD